MSALKARTVSDAAYRFFGPPPRADNDKDNGNDNDDSNDK